MHNNKTLYFSSPILLLILLVYNTANSQKEKALRDIQLLTPLSIEDSINLCNLPSLTLPESYLGSNAPFLPTIVDNTTHPCWRPVFAQVALECGQAAGVGLGFTYEINRMRDVPGDVEENQYASHFTWNFGNGGTGYYGVSYFHSFEIVSTLGTPNVPTYGGMSAGGGGRWMTGYDNYYHSMHNRITEVYQIDCSTEEGILTAKHWLQNHLEGSEVGGVANFYTSAPYVGSMPVLPPGTPEEGMYVITSWGGANHALTISGFHDSICWDYNDDGQYTNDIDLNGDGIITPSDWEIGGFRFANTYSGGPNFGNDGFSYMTYKSAADPYGGGGIWNSAIHVVYAKANTDPLLTAKVTLKHTCREQIRVRVGVSTDQSSENPDYILSLPVFNFQGACRYMQGDTTEAAKTIEFGLDLTPLLNMVGPNTPSRYFILVDEDDPNNWSPGEIVQYSLMDYTNGVTEILCNQNNIGIVNNSLTKAWVDHTVTFDEVEITTDTLPLATVFEPYSVNLEATGGAEPYVWDYDMNFTETNYNSSFPMVSDEELYPGGGYAAKNLDFPFPFYGEEFNTVRVYADGYIMFEGSINWPYQVYDFLLFTKNKYIAPFMADLNLYSGIGDGLWYKGDTTSAIFRWKASVDGMQNTSVLNFAVELHKNGDIEFYYGPLNDYPIMEWISGVSAGDNKYYQFTEVNSDASIPQEYVCDLRAFHQPDGFIVSRDGIFGGTPTEIYDNLEIKFRAQDENGLSNSKQLYFSTDGTSYLVVNDFSVISGDDDVIEFGETVSLSVDIKNLGEEAIYGASIETSSEDIYIVLIDSTEFLGDFNPGQVKTFESAFEFNVENQVPDEYDIDINTYIADNSGNDWSNHLYLTAFAPEIYVGGVAIDDGGGGGLDPGETADMIVNLCNGGGATAENLIVTLSSSDPYVTINSNIANLSYLNGNDVGQVTFSITASDQTPMGHILEFDVDIEADNEYVTSDVAFVLVGLINESFETGDFSAYPWSFGGDSEWIIDNEEYFEGAFSARSGDIGDDQKSSLLLNIYVIGDGEISFYKKVSSEASYDYLRFFIDAEEMVSWAGDMDWGIVTYPVSPGLHEFEWMYEKDYSVSTGSDCGWIDFITFPLFGDPNPSMSYEPSSFVLTLGNEIVTDTIILTNEGDGPLIYNVSAVDTLGLAVDWLNIGSQSGGINSGGSKEIPLVFDATDLEEGNYVAYIIVADHMDNEYIISVFMLVDVETGIENETVINGTKNIPNPFRNWTNITFSLSQPENVSLEIFDHFGARVKTFLLNKEYSEGSHSIKWEGTNEHGVKVTPGLYYYRMTVGKTIQTGKMILLD